MQRLEPGLEAKLQDYCRLLVDQNRARVVVSPQANESGYWFGGGNAAIGPDGGLYLIGRYRNAGDSRTGVAAGTRGLKLAIFRSVDGADNFEEVASLGKDDLIRDGLPVLSIEGSAIRFDDSGVEVIVSTEKDAVGYPEGFGEFLKPGTGVWSIDRIRASSIDELSTASVERMLESNEPATIHVKDPFLYETASERVLLFCSHPFSWTCSGTGQGKLDAAKPNGVIAEEDAVFDFFPRGNVWDVAMSRGTCVVDVPNVGEFAHTSVQLMFYDGGECVRDLDAHAKSVARPRGYSCEELGGVAYCIDGDWRSWHRLSRYEPMFVSPWGTGCSRYVDVLQTSNETIVTWQQSQEDYSQPLVMNRVSRSEVESVLS